MLIMFKVKNFLSFKDETILDLRATEYTEHPTHILNHDDIKVLKSTAIYGPNASGKSNLISAMFFFKQYILEKSFNNQDTNFKASSFSKLESFLLNSNVNDISELEIIFYYNQKQFQYGFECTTKEVISEWYYIDDEKVFERENTMLSFGEKYNEIIGTYKKVSNERLFISILIFFGQEEDKKIVLDDFVEFISKKYHIYFELFFNLGMKDMNIGIILNKKLFKDEMYFNKVEKYLKQIDVGIDGIEIQTERNINQKTGKRNKKQVIKTIHNVYDENRNIVRKQYFNLNQESNSTLKFLLYIQYIVEVIEQGGVFIVDEITANLHSLLTKLIVDIFQDNANTNAQLIFTTHDVSILNDKQFRRDEIVFIDKDNTGVSKLYALSDFKKSENEDFNKDYLQGRYGAIPIFDYDTIFGGE